MGSFRSQFGQLPRIPAQTPLFHESGNKICVRFRLLHICSRHTPSGPTSAVRFLRYAETLLGLVLLTAPTAGTLAAAQSTSPADSPTTTAQNPSTDASQQKPGRVTTTVIVHGEVKDNYLSDAGTAGQS